VIIPAICGLWNFDNFREEDYQETLPNGEK
jgi:hypothetical protein